MQYSVYCVVLIVMSLYSSLRNNTAQMSSDSQVVYHVLSSYRDENGLCIHMGMVHHWCKKLMLLQGRDILSSKFVWDVYWWYNVSRGVGGRYFCVIGVLYRDFVWGNVWTRGRRGGGGGDVCTSGGLEGRTGLGDEINLQPRLKVPTEGPVKNKISKDFQDL